MLEQMSMKTRILGRLAQGGSADIYAAEFVTEAGDELVAVKKVREPDLEARRALEFEYDRLARLRHPNILRPLHYDVTNGTLVMELLHGATAHRVFEVSRSKPLAWRLAFGVYLAGEVLAALHSVHELRDAAGKRAGLVHRDCSSRNVFVTLDGAVRLLDFGIVKGAEDPTQTATGLVRGSLEFLSPEQAMSLPLDRRADIFAVGLILYHAIAGHSIWEGMDETAIFRALLEGSHWRPIPGLSVPFERVMQRTLSRDSRLRPETAEELRFELYALADDLPPHDPPRHALRLFMSQHFEPQSRALQAALEVRRRAGVEDPSPLPME